MRPLTRTFLKGLALILPLALTLAVIVWLASMAEAILGAALRVVLPDEAYVPGTGLLAGVLVILAAGVTVNLWITRQAVRAADGPARA